MNRVTKAVAFALFIMVMAKLVNGQTIRLGEDPHAPDIVLREGPFYLLIDNKGNLTTAEPELFRTSNEVRIEYDLDGRIKRFGSTSIDYDLDGRVRQIGDARKDYDLDGRIRLVGSKRIDYNFIGKIERIGDESLDYDLSGRVRQFDPYARLRHLDDQV